MEDWIRNVEHLMGTDYDDEPCPLLEEFESDDSPNSLIRRTDAFLNRTDASDEVIHEVRDHCIDDVLEKMVKKIVATWRKDVVSVEAQYAIEDASKLMTGKTYFIVCCIFGKMLRSEKWVVHQEEIFKAVNSILLAVITVAKKYPHKPKNSADTRIHFQVKTFLCEASLRAWSGIFESDEIHNKNRPLVAIPTDLLLPTMRRLGMLDLLDENWNMFGPWDEVLDHIANSSGGISKVPADKILAEKSYIWNKARNSIACRRMSRNHSFGRDPAPQCFRYFNKCSVDMCCNVETAKKPHKHRCTKCYYFHFCSDACKNYADMFDLHDCDFTPPDKVASIKKEMESYLGLNKTQNNTKHEVCNFCRMKRADLPADGALLQCMGCKSVAYCSKDCQLWDWSSEHKSKCGKN